MATRTEILYNSVARMHASNLYLVQRRSHHLTRALGARHAIMKLCRLSCKLTSLPHTPPLPFSIVRGATAPATAPAIARIGQLQEWYQYGIGMVWCDRASPASTFVSRPAAWCPASTRLPFPRLGSGGVLLELRVNLLLAA